MNGFIGIKTNWYTKVCVWE